MGFLAALAPLAMGGAAAGGAAGAGAIGSSLLGSVAASAALGGAMALLSPKPPKPATVPPPPSINTSMKPMQSLAQTNPAAALGGTMTGNFGAPSTQGKSLLGQ